MDDRTETNQMFVYKVSLHRNQYYQQRIGVISRLERQKIQFGKPPFLYVCTDNMRTTYAKLADIST
jgi:hypothetical protein